jgi:hypothetical protein
LEPLQRPDIAFRTRIAWLSRASRKQRSSRQAPEEILGFSSDLAPAPDRMAEIHDRRRGDLGEAMARKLKDMGLLNVERGNGGVLA